MKEPIFTPNLNENERVSYRAVVRLYKVFGSHYKKFWKEIVGVYILLFVGILLGVLSPWPLKLILDYVILKTPLPERFEFLNNWFQNDALLLLSALVAGFILLHVLSSVLSYFQSIRMVLVSTKMMLDIRERVFTHIQRLSVFVHKSVRSGDLISRLTIDMNNIQGILLSVPQAFVNRILTIASITGVMLLMNWRLAVIAFSAIPVLFLIHRRIGKGVQTATRKRRNKEVDITSFVLENVTSMALVQAYGREDVQQARFRDENRESLKTGLAAMRLTKAFKRANKIVIACGTAGVVYYGGALALDGAILPGTLILFTSYLKRLYSPIKKMSLMLMGIAKAQVSGERLLELVECDMITEDDPDAVPAPRLKGEILFDAVSFSYDEESEVLKNVSFTAQAGETIALVGHSGAGKTTLISLLLRFYDPHSGKIKIDGLEHRTFTLKSLRNQVTVLMQDAKLFNKSVRDNIAFGKIGATEDEIVRAAKLAQAHEFILAMPQGYDTMISEGGENLSGGQKQRINIARAMIRNTPILILDEPATALDMKTEELIHKALARLSNKKTTFIIAHRFSTIARADKILVLDGGELVGFATHAELMQSCRHYQDFYKLQFGTQSKKTRLPVPKRGGDRQAVGTAGKPGRQTQPRLSKANMPDRGPSRAEAQFPQLQEMADADTLHSVLAKALQPYLATDITVTYCKVKRTYYKPGSDCRILFRITFSDGQDREVGQQLFFGKLFSSKPAKEVLNSLDQQSLGQPTFGPPVVLVNDWQMILWAYPNDPELHGLPLMVDDEKVLQLAQAAPERLGLQKPPSAISGELAKYVPGMRCGFVYRIRENGANGSNGPSSHAIFAKTYRAGKGEQAFQKMRQIWDSAARHRGDFVLPQPYDYDPKYDIVWQQALNGLPLGKIALTLPDLPAVSREVGRRLAAFHGISIDLPDRMSIDFEQEELQKTVAKINRSFPRFADRCNAVSQKLLAAAGELGPGITTPVHASFKLSHILATDAGIAFIDFDGANLGDPGYDLGRFVAHLYNLQSKEKLDAAVAADASREFCEGYNDVAVSRVSQERIDWFAASHLVSSQVFKAVKRVNPDQVGSLLAAATRLCPKMNGASSVSSHTTLQDQEGNRPDNLKWEQLNDRDRMLQIFQEELPGFRDGGLKIDSLSVKNIRHKEGRKHHLLYTLRVTDRKSGQEGEQLFFATVEPVPLRDRDYSEALRSATANPPFGPPLHFIGDLNMLLWGFPNDPRLASLSELFDRHACTERLLKFDKSIFPGIARSTVELDTQPIKYVPLDRCTCRHHLKTGANEEAVVFSKMYTPETDGGLIFRTIQTLHEAPDCQNGLLLIPEPLHFASDLNTIFVRGLAGTNLDESIGKVDLRAIAEKVAVGLAGIHRCRIEGLESYDDRTTVEQVKEAATLLGKIEPSHSGRITKIYDVLSRRHAVAKTRAAVPIHRAFRLSQLLLVGDRIALIDFDDFLLGNPLTDVSSFIAHVLYLSLKGKLTRDQACSAVSQFCQTYSASTPWGLAEDLLAVHVAAQLVGKHAKKLVRPGKRRHRHRVEQLLDLAEGIVEGEFGFGVNCE